MIVCDKQVSFLRYTVDDGVRLRHHPHNDKHTAYQDPALFSEHYYPEVKTECVQNENILVAVRSMEKLRNKLSSICDSLIVQRFDGRVDGMDIDRRQWVIVSSLRTRKPTR